MAQTATFTSDLGKAGNSLDNFGKSAQGAGQAMDFNMREARGSLMLMEHELGFRLPREMNTLIASIPGIGVAFEALLPIMGVVFAGKMIYDFMEKVKAAEGALSEGFLKALENTTDKSDVLRVSIAETQLKIDTLLGKPTSGDASVLEMAKLRVEADKLSASLGKDLDEFIKLMGAATHGSVMTALLGGAGAGGQAGDVAKGLKEELAKLPKDAADYGAQVQKALTDSWGRAQSEITKNEKAVNEARAENAARIAAGEAPVHEHDYTKQTQALREYQTQLSAVYAQEDDHQKKDAGEARLKGIEESQKAAADAFKESSRTMHQAMELMKSDAEFEAKMRLEAIDELQREAKERIAYANMVARAEDAKVKEIIRLAGEDFSQTERMDKLKLEEAKEQARYEFAIRQGSAQAILEQEKGDVNKVWALEKEGYDKRIDLLKKYGKTYEAEIKKLQNEETAGERKHDLEINKLTHKAEEDKYKFVEAAENKIASVIASTAAKSIVEGKSMGAAFAQMGKQMEAAALENFLMMMTIDGRKKLMNAKSAARGAYTGVMDMDLPPAIGFPLAIASGAAAFAGVMAFEQGGKIPGYGPRTIVAHGGETVVQKALVDRVEASEGRGGRGVTHNHYNIVTKDVDGFKASQSQILGKQHHAAEVAARKNGR